MNTPRKIFIIPLLALFLCLSCDKDPDQVIPYVRVGFTVNLNIVNELTIPGNSVYFPGAGYGGVLICCESDGSYSAYDAACTYEVSRSCILKNEGNLATCPCCESMFIMVYGAYPSKGPAIVPLQPYHVSVSGNTLHVYN